MVASFLPGYSDTLVSDALKREGMGTNLSWWMELTHYEVKKNECKDDLDLWPAITQVHVCLCT